MGIVAHGFAAGQRWKNEYFILYILSVNDDYRDEHGNLQPGKICVTEEKPFPGKNMIATDLPPAAMQNVIEKGGYAKMETGWHEEFVEQKKAIDAAEAMNPKPAPIVAPPLSGIGIMAKGRGA